MSQRVARETLQGHVIYPKELPCSRGDMKKISSITIIIFLLVICLGDAKHKHVEYSSFFVTLGSFLTVTFLSECLRRILYSLEEMKHLQSRHMNSQWRLFKKIFNFTPSAWCLGILCLMFILVAFLQNLDIELHIQSISLVHFCGLFLISCLLQDIVVLTKNPVHDSVFLESLQRLDYGSGMAQSYFYGYLRLCLPNTGDQEKGILERIDDYTAKEKIPDELFPVKKLFIVIPSTSYIPNDLKDCSFGWMQSVGTLEKVIKDRAGCKQRVYHNSVYRIKNPDDVFDPGVYVVAEGATPCKTLYEVVEYSGVRQEFYKMHQKEIIFNFYKTLRETIRENRDCKGLCEIIYYVETDEFGHNNVNVGKLIRQRIMEIQENEEFLKVYR